MPLRISWCLPSVCLMLTSSFCHACPADVEAQIGSHFGPTTLLSCKQNPAKPEQTLAAFSYDSHELDEQITQRALGVAVIQNGVIVASRTEPKAIYDDAISLTRITLDTARYRLSPQLRAFGIRLTFQGSSRVNPLFQTALNLYTVESGDIRRVLTALSVEQESGEWDGNCEGTITSQKTVITVEPAVTLQYADLRLLGTTTDTVGIHSNAGDCTNTMKKQPVTSQILHFNGREYEIPAELKVNLLYSAP